MAKERPRQNQSNREREKILQQEERSIATFGQITQKFSDDMSNFLTSFKGTVDEFGKVQKETVKQNKKKLKDETKSKGVSEFEAKARKVPGYDKVNKFANDVFGKRSADGFVKRMAKWTGFIGNKTKGAGGGGFGKGMLGNAAKGLTSLAGGLIRAAGPIGAIFGVGKAIFDFFDAGGLAKLKSGFKMFTGNKMTGAEDIASVEKDLEGTEQMRKLNAEYNYKVPMQLRQQAADDMLNYQKGIEQDQLTYNQSLVKDKLEYEIGLRKDALQFQEQQTRETLDAELEKRKTIASSGMSFIKNYSNISERALKAIGSSTKEIIQGIAKFQTVFGNSVKESFKLSENAQGLAYHFGVGADDVLNMTNLFRLMGKTSAMTAENLVAGITQFADINDLAPQAIFAQIKDAGEDIYKFSSGTAENFVKQAGLLTKMSVSMSQMMKASDTMVLNYKDSIKAEMGLSAMLGKNINLSEVRAKLMSGDQAGAASALKSALGGVDVGAMNPFAKQQLMQATGMDISAIMGIQQGKEGSVKGPLTENEKAGKAFADGALKQDIANAAAKLALEQEQRKKMLEFEQNQRLIMLQVEQAQRLDGIFLEQKYRALAAEKGYKDAREEMAVDLIKDQAANFAMNLKSGTASSLNRQGLTDATQMKPFLTKIEGVDTSLTNLMSSGLVKGTDMRLAEFLTKKMDIISTAGKKDKDKNIIGADQIGKQLEAALANIFGSEVKALNDQRKAQSDAAEKRIKAAEEFAKVEYQSRFGQSFRKTQAAENEIAKKYGLATEEVAKAKAMLKVEYANGKARGITGVSVDQTMVDELRKANDIDTQTKEQIKVGNTSVTAEVKASGEKGIAAQSALKLEQQKMLSEGEYHTLIQERMLVMLGLQVEYLNDIAESNRSVTSVNLDGKKVLNTLTSRTTKNYGLTRAGMMGVK